MREPQLGSGHSAKPLLKESVALCHSPKWSTTPMHYPTDLIQLSCAELRKLQKESLAAYARDNEAHMKQDKAIHAEMRRRHGAINPEELTDFLIALPESKWSGGIYKQLGDPITVEDLEHLEWNEYPSGKPVMGVKVNSARPLPVRCNGEIDIPVRCTELAERSGIANETLAQYFIDIADGKSPDLLPEMGPDLSANAARREQIEAVANCVIHLYCGSCPQMDACQQRARRENTRRGEDISGVSVDEIATYLTGPSDEIPFTWREDREAHTMFGEQIGVALLMTDGFSSEAHDKQYRRYEILWRKFSGQSFEEDQEAAE
jgi:hypothetical protein